MLKIGTKEECKMIAHLPPQVQCEVETVIAKLNFYYGEHRNIDNDLGGFVLIIEDVFDYEKAGELFNRPVFELIPEYVKKIDTSEESYTNSLILCNSDFSISIVTTLSLTPPPFLKYIESED